jgi:hypothetical protein
MSSLGVFVPWFAFNQDIWALVLFFVILAIVLHFLGKEDKAAGDAGPPKRV